MSSQGFYFIFALFYIILSLFMFMDVERATFIAMLIYKLIALFIQNKIKEPQFLPQDT